MDLLTPSPAARAALSALPAAGVVEAVVERALADAGYVLRVFGRRIEVLSQVPLVVGAKLSLRMEGQGDTLVFRLGGAPEAAAAAPPTSGSSAAAAASPPSALSAGSVPLPSSAHASAATAPASAAAAAIEALGLPGTPAREAAARALIEQGAPVTRENLAAVERFAGPASEPARIHAAAFLLARGVTDLESVGEPLARALAAPLAVADLLVRLDAVGESAVPTGGAHPLAVGGSVLGTEGLARLASALEARVARLLATDPLLIALDRLLARIPAPGAGAPEASPELRAAIEAAFARPTDAEALTRLGDRLERLDPPAREAAAAFLVRREREAIDRLTGLAPLRDALSAVKEAGDRAGVFRTINLLSQARGDATYLFELPVMRDGRAFSLAVKVRRDGRGGATASGTAQASVLVRVDLSQLGLVTCAIGVRDRRVDVSIRVRDAAVRKRFRQNSPELTGALTGLGLAARVAVDVRAEGEEEWLDWLFDLPAGERPGLDVRV